jgi:crotonobetainyl-CoA:carnitine CoA-transferase CaiB-like acyl-CoA transferase
VSLNQLLVIEFAGVLAGPSVGMFLAELGARVIKIENPASGGDVTRSWRTPEERSAERPSAYFSSVNWGKESVCLDLKDPDDLAIALDLVAIADVVLVSFKAGGAKQLGLDYETLSSTNPRLVYGEITAYGPGDPRTGYDAVIQAETGFTFLNGPVDGGPTKMPVALMDVLAGHQLKEGILLALLERERTGRGSSVSVSLVRSGLAALINQGSNWLLTGLNPRRLGSGHPNIVPYGTTWETADRRHIVLAIGNDEQFARLCGILGRPDLAADERFATNPARVVHREELEAILAERIVQWDGGALLEELSAAKVPAGPIRDVREALEQADAAPLLLAGAASSPTGLRSVAFEPSEHYRPEALRPPPELGEHTGAALRELLGIEISGGT